MVSNNVLFGPKIAFGLNLPALKYTPPRMTEAFLHGTVHQAGADLVEAIHSAAETLTLWQSLTPLGRNEFICWVEDAKQAKTRAQRIVRTCEELLEGKKRPCCWVGCIHREDKAPSPWQQAVLIDGKRK